MSKTALVEGELTTEDTAVTLTTEGSVTAADRKVPAGAKEISELAVSFAGSFDAADGCVFYVRLGGRGIKGGDQIIVVAAGGGVAVQSGADPTANGGIFHIDDVGIGANPGSDITFKAEMVAGDIGDATLTVWVKYA